MCGQPAAVETIRRLVEEGRWQQASNEIQQALADPRLSFQNQQDFLFQNERMSRIRLDFSKTRDQVFREARAAAPMLDETTFSRWEKAGFVELINIDGACWYLNRAANNLFRICSEARPLKAKQSGDAFDYSLEDIRNVIASYDRTRGRLHTPRHWRAVYSLTVNADAVPAGETIRAWLPFCHEGNRQSNVRLISSDPPQSVRSGTAGTLASVYMEKTAAQGQPTEFKISFEFTSAAHCQPIDPEKVCPISREDPELMPFLAEQSPHIVFTREVRQLSQDVAGTETNLFRKAKLFFKWVDEHIPWAGAREYSTLDSLPLYALKHRHGDCGIQTMLFMTLCRLNGIPARWESGWTMSPVKNMHDWCEIYLAPYGWVPVDVSFGLVDSKLEREKWFYLGNIDAGRLAVNTDYGQPLFPAKIHFRSEIVDFQRGEAEWRGGNLYFNHWQWNFNVQEVSPSR